MKKLSIADALIENFLLRRFLTLCEKKFQIHFRVVDGWEGGLLKYYNENEIFLILAFSYSLPVESVSTGQYQKVLH